PCSPSVWGDAIFSFDFPSSAWNFRSIGTAKVGGKFKTRMARVDLGGKKSGSIWMKRPEGRAKDSLLLEVTNTLPGLRSQSGRRLVFSHAAFGQQGSWLVVSDQLGDLYLLTSPETSLVSCTVQDRP
ncbi:hypothetical protein GBAR_LOCUS21667, partial [Geodia barretti]